MATGDRNHQGLKITRFTMQLTVLVQQNHATCVACRNKLVWVVDIDTEGVNSCKLFYHCNTIQTQEKERKRERENFGTSLVQITHYINKKFVYVFSLHTFHIYTYTYINTEKIGRYRHINLQVFTEQKLY